MSEAEKLSLQISNLRKYRDGLVPYSSDGLRKAKQYVLTPVIPHEEDREGGARRKRAKSEDSPSKGNASLDHQLHTHQTEISNPEKYDRLTALSRILLETLEEQGALRALLEHTVEPDMILPEKLNQLGLESRLRGTLAELEKTVQKLTQVRIDLDQERKRRISSERALQIAISDLEERTNQLEKARQELQEVKKGKAYSSEDRGGNQANFPPLVPPPPLSPPPIEESQGPVPLEPHSPRQENKEEKTLSSIVLDIDLGDGLKGSIDVTPRSNPIELAYEFVYRHALNPDYVYPLIEYITKTKTSLDGEIQIHSHSPIQNEDLNYGDSSKHSHPMSPDRKEVDEKIDTMNQAKLPGPEISQSHQQFDKELPVVNDLVERVVRDETPQRRFEGVKSAVDTASISPGGSDIIVGFHDLSLNNDDPVSPLVMDQSQFNSSPSRNGTFDLSVTEEDILPISTLVPQKSISLPSSLSAALDQPKRKYPTKEQLNFHDEHFDGHSKFQNPNSQCAPRNPPDSSWQLENYDNTEVIADSDSEIASVDLQQLQDEEDSYILRGDEEDSDQITDYPTFHYPASTKQLHSVFRKEHDDSFEDDNYSAVDLEDSSDGTQGSYNPTILLNQIRREESMRNYSLPGIKTPTTQSSSASQLPQSPRGQRHAQPPTIANELSMRAQDLDPLEVAIEVFDSATTLANEGNIDDAIPLYLHALKLFEEHDAEELPMIREEIWRWVSLADDAVARDKMKIPSEGEVVTLSTQQNDSQTSQVVTPHRRIRGYATEDLRSANQYGTRPIEKPQEVLQRPKQKRNVPNIDIL